MEALKHGAEIALGLAVSYGVAYVVGALTGQQVYGKLKSLYVRVEGTVSHLVYGPKK